MSEYVNNTAREAARHRYEPTAREKMLRLADKEARAGHEVRLKESSQTGELLMFVERKYSEEDFR